MTRDTTSNAMERLRKLYQKKDRLEATVTLQKQTYDEPRKQVDYEFHANQGPEVKVSVEGAKISKSRLHLLVPIYRRGDDRQRPAERRGVQYSRLCAAAGVLRCEGGGEGDGGRIRPRRAWCSRWTAG